MLERPRLVLAGTGTGVGKTTVMLGLLGALARRGLDAAPFKAGPDFIDPGHHTAALGGRRVSRNLDGWMMSEDAVRELFLRASATARLSLIEGMMGLFDGLSGDDDAGSAAHLARLLDAPVVLVVDASGLSGSAAAVVKGFASLDPRVRVAGVVFNRVAGEGHYGMLKAAVGRLDGIRCLGWIRGDEALRMPERHLGLVPASERSAALALMADRVEAGVDLEALVALADAAPLMGEAVPTLFDPALRGRFPARVAVARDEALHFLYEDNLDFLRHLGAEVRFFSPLRDGALPPGADLVWLPGGYPECFAGGLASNRSLLAALRAHQAAGKVLYAECGGLMLAVEALVDAGGTEHGMAGLLCGRAVMTPRWQGLGYVEVEVLADTPPAVAGRIFRAHEFHFSTLEGAGPPVWALKRPGVPPKPGAWSQGRALATYAHVHFAAAPDLATRLLREARA